MSSPLRRRTDTDRNASPLRALVVDDDENYRVFMRALLRRLGFEVSTASDGREAEQVVEDHSFDLLVIDCEMPRVSGLDLIAAVRENSVCSDTYAIMLTGREDLDTKINALRLGFDDFIVKSTSEVEIVARFGAARRLITRQRRLDITVRELYGLATRDELTGLFNRRYFFSEAERLIAEESELTLVLLDLDGFKPINDTYGHLAGDRILRDIGSLFLRRTRQHDIVARYGGDEFVLLMKNCKIPECEKLAARLASEIGSLQWTLGDDTIHVGVSTGFSASIYLDRPSVSQLLNAADRDLYKNKWVRSHPDLDPSLYEYPNSRLDKLADVMELRSDAPVQRRANE
jgi:two-component system cell cycle response regulator